MPSFRDILKSCAVITDKKYINRTNNWYNNCIKIIFYIELNIKRVVGLKLNSRKCAKSTWLYNGWGGAFKYKLNYK